MTLAVSPSVRWRSWSGQDAAEPTGAEQAAVKVGRPELSSLEYVYSSEEPAINRSDDLLDCGRFLRQCNDNLHVLI